MTKYRNCFQTQNYNLQLPTLIDKDQEKRKASVRISKPTAPEKKKISKALEMHSMLYDPKKEIPSTLQDTEGELTCVSCHSLHSKFIKV